MRNRLRDDVHNRLLEILILLNTMISLIAVRNDAIMDIYSLNSIII